MSDYNSPPSRPTSFAWCLLSSGTISAWRTVPYHSNTQRCQTCATSTGRVLAFSSIQPITPPPSESLPPRRFTAKDGGVTDTINRAIPCFQHFPRCRRKDACAGCGWVFTRACSFSRALVVWRIPVPESGGLVVSAPELPTHGVHEERQLGFGLRGAQHRLDVGVLHLQQQQQQQATRGCRSAKYASEKT